MAPSTYGSILLLENSEDDAFFFKRAWKVSGRSERLIRVENGIEAKKVLLESLTAPSVFKLIITDLKMSGCNGFEFLQWLRSEPNLKDTKCIVFSSSFEARDIQEAKALGANGYFTKPSRSDAYVQVLDQMEECLNCPSHVEPADGKNAGSAQNREWMMSVGPIHKAPIERTPMS